MEKKVSTVRCLACRERFEVEMDARTKACPNCGKVWKISWPWPGEARIEGHA